MYTKSNQMEKKIFTVPQLAQYLELSERTVRAYLNKGELTGFKKLNKWFVFLDDVEKFIKT